MIRSIRARLSYANVVATLALVGVVAGGTAYAANTIHSTDIIDGEVKTADLANGAVTNGKLAGDARTRAFSFSGPNTDGSSARHVVVNLGGLQLAVRCDHIIGLASLEVFAKNLGTTTAQVNGGWVKQTLQPPSTINNNESNIDGFALAPGVERTLDLEPFGTATRSMIAAGGDGPETARAEGQIQFHREGNNDVTSVDFHAFVDSAGSCAFQGTAVHAIP